MSRGVSSRRGAVSALAGAALVLLGLVAVVGFAHTDAGRPVLHWLAARAGCPVDFEGGDPALVEAYRIRQLRQRAGVRPARSSAALGFSLGQTDRVQVNAWADRVNAECAVRRKGSVLHCRFPGAHSLEELALDDVHLQFDKRDRLVAVDVFRVESCGHDAIVHLRRLDRHLSDAVGPSTNDRGVLDEEYLNHDYRRAAFEYNYRNYTARISATNLGPRGIRVREQYQWASPPG